MKTMLRRIVCMMAALAIVFSSAGGVPFVAPAMALASDMAVTSGDMNCPSCTKMKGDNAGCAASQCTAAAILPMANKRAAIRRIAPIPGSVVLLQGRTYRPLISPA